VDGVARQVHGSGDTTRESLDELADEGLVERYDGPIGPTYALNGTQPVFDILVWPTSMLGNGPPVMA
jgi:hypothetical protein